MKKLPIYKVTANRCLKMIEDVDYLDCIEYIVDLSNQAQVDKLLFDNILIQEDEDEYEYAIFTQFKNRTQDYQIMLKKKCETGV